MAKRLGWYRSEQLILKITLFNSKPKIWRRVEVHSGLTLHDFHFVIQNVFDWTDSHLYHFLVTPEGKLTGAALRDAQRYHVLPPDPYFDNENDRRADEELIGRVFTPQCNQIVYEYDFGDSWNHIIKLEKRSPGGDPYHIPQCLAGENAAPLDDMGGIYGYYQYIEALHDDTQDRHEQALEWLGEEFDPARFDLDRANQRLTSCFKPVPRRPRKSRKSQD